MGAAVGGGAFVREDAGAFVREDLVVAGWVARGSVPAGNGWKINAVLGRSCGFLELVTGW